MHPWIEKHIQDQPVLLDGAWGTQLQVRGLPIGACADGFDCATTSLLFELPAFATSFRGAVGLDTQAGHGGCAQASVQLLGTRGKKW